MVNILGNILVVYLVIAEPLHYCIQGDSYQKLPMTFWRELLRAESLCEFSKFFKVCNDDLFESITFTSN